MTSNVYLDNDDLRFHIEKGYDFAEVAALMERGFTDPDGHKNLDEAREFYRDVLENVGAFVAAEIVPHIRKLDSEHPRMEGGEVVHPPVLTKILDGFKEMGLYGLNLPRELGGMNAPMVTYLAVAEMLARADPSLVGHFGFYGGIALSLLAYSLKEGSVEHKGRTILKTRFDDAIAEIAAGEAWGCMVLTEPDAGSDLGALRAKARLGDDQKWRITGQKIFITSGDGQHQLVLAKTEDSGEGLKDLSLFLVPRKITRDGKTVDNVVIDRLEDKLGIHASVTAALSYDESVGELLGQRGQGFELMLLLMNNARLGVGFECIGLIEAVYRLAKDYADQRVSMGQPIAQHEMIADYLDKMEVELRGLRALAFRAAYYVDLYNQLEWQLQLDPPTDADELKTLTRRIKKLKWKARELTPLIKFQASEKAVELSALSLQIHGGVGYTTDYLVEKYLRDAYVMTIYEGTSEIQALMALKDQLQKALKDLPEFVREAAQIKILSMGARDPLQRKLALLKSKVYGAMQHILARIAKDKWSYVADKKLTEWPSAFLKDWDAKRDFGFGLLHAKRLTRMLSEVATAKVLVKQAELYPERRELAERYLERCTPVVFFMHDEIIHFGDHVLEKLSHYKAPEAEDKAAG
ncbi:MAG: acyl-CoA dehydrogenase family protein [Pseudomonadota bacterium]